LVGEAFGRLSGEFREAQEARGTALKSGNISGGHLKIYIYISSDDLPHTEEAFRWPLQHFTHLAALIIHTRQRDETA
jgi:hypothetical protein